MNTNNLSIEVRSELRVYGRDLEGRDYLAPLFVVIATAASGERWIHEHGFAACKPGFTPDGEPYFSDISERAEARAFRLAERVRAADSIDLARWQPTAAAYGSAMHDEAELIAFEAGKEF